jgi:hypothetical protein
MSGNTNMATSLDFVPNQASKDAQLEEQAIPAESLSVDWSGEDEEKEKAQNTAFLNRLALGGLNFSKKK